MAENLQSLYDVGVLGGFYESALSKSSGIQSLSPIVANQYKVEQENLSQMYGTLSDIVGLTSQVYGGYKDKKEFKEEILPSMKKIFGEKPVEKERSILDKVLGAEKEYTVGDKTFSKSEIKAISMYSKYGMNPSSISDIFDSKVNMNIETKDTPPLEKNIPVLEMDENLEDSYVFSGAEPYIETKTADYPLPIPFPPLQLKRAPSFDLSMWDEYLD